LYHFLYSQRLQVTFAITAGKKRPISHNKKREAVAPIAGYVYQFWQSAYAWIHLSEGEILILEAAEDFDIHTDTPDVETVQVKLSGKAITLRSPDVVEAIGHYWDHVHANPRHTIRFRFLTTATPTVEQGEPFGRAVAGISFWNSCRTDTEIESIRDFLLALDIPAALKNFLRTANTSDIKQTFLNRIRWDTGAMSADAIARATEAAVTVQAARFGILPEDASKITDRLVVEVIKKLISSDRALTAEDYLRFLEQEATVRIARSRLIELESLEAKVRKPEGGAVSFGGVAYRGLPPLDRRICRRTELVNDLADRLEQDGAVILQGGTGTGKTILAALVSATSSMDVWWVRLRGFSARETATALMRLSEEIENGSPKTLVLDDLDLSRAIQHYEFGLRVLAYQARFLGVNIIVTSQAPATRQALSILGDGTVTRSPEVKVAPLSEAEVRDLLLQNGVADDKNATFWARLLRATTRGHPQLVDARIANLRERGWPQDSMEDLIGSEVIRDTKIELRKRLMDDVPTESARTLAYRLSILDFPFKRDLALTLGSLAPELKNPGDALDLLIGPWIEVIEKDSYRISPLLEDAASEVWAAKQVQQLKASAAEALGKKEHITPWEGSGGLALALASKNKEVLTHWLYALLNTPENILAKVALAFEWVALIGARKGERAYAEDSALNNLLRFFQFRVSAESSEPERAIKIAQSWLGEINSFTGEKKRLALLLYYAQIVMRYTVPFSPTIVVTSLAKLFQEKESILKNAFSESMGGLPWLGDVQITGELVLLQIQILRKWTPDQIVEFLSAVGDQPEPTRSLMLRMFRIDEEAVSVMVNKVTSSLPDDSNVGTFDRYLAVLRQIADKGIEWNARPLSASAFRAIAVLQSENIKDPQAALRTLDQATTLIGETAVLTDQKARVYFIPTSTKRPWPSGTISCQAGRRQALSTVHSRSDGPESPRLVRKDGKRHSSGSSSGMSPRPVLHTIASSMSASKVTWRLRNGRPATERNPCAFFLKS